MTTPSRKRYLEAGSRMHVLDWLGSGELVPKLRSVVAGIGFSIPDGANCQPEGHQNHRETTLMGASDKFLTSDTKLILRQWWVVHMPGKFPTWDFVTSAIDKSGRPSLVLVEAKAHKAELNFAGKTKGTRKTRDQQNRSNENHIRIGFAISEAQQHLLPVIPQISLSRDLNYQFSNRIAFSWKLASLGIPVCLIYLGFTQDSGIGMAGEYFATEKDWSIFLQQHLEAYFPETHFAIEIACGKGSFWFLPFHLPCKNTSLPIAKRKEKA